MSTGNKTLYTFGCSFTFGQGFPDCDNNSDTVPSKFAWPALVAESLDMEIENLAMPGCSGFELVRAFMRNVDKIKPGDPVAIQWPFLHRWCLFWGPDLYNVLKIYPGHSGAPDAISIGRPGDPDISVSKFYSDYTTDYQFFEIFLVMVSLVENTCKLRNIDVLHYMGCSEEIVTVKQMLKHPNYKWFTTKFQPIAFNKFAYTKSWPAHFNRQFGNLPDGHFDSDTHELFGEVVRRQLIRQGFV